MADEMTPEREMAWPAAADFIERFADDDADDHNVTIHDDGYRYPHYARCSCGWRTPEYVKRLPIEDMMRMHEGDTR